MKGLYYSFISILLVLICLSLLSGCGAITTPQTVKPDWHDNSARIISGKTDRETVKDILGNPFISSNYWNIDVFRQYSRQVAIPIMVLPIFYVSNRIYRYTLVTYDENKIVNGIDTGLYRPARAPIEYTYQALELKTGAFTFVIGAIDDSFDRAEGTLLVDSSQKKSYLQSLYSVTNCLAIIVRNTNGGDNINLDNGKRKLTMRPLPSMSAYSLSPGQHSVEISHHRTGGQNVKTFSCEKGEVDYIVNERIASEAPTVADGFLFGILYGISFGQLGPQKMGRSDFDIKIYREMPEEFAEPPLIIWHDGMWVANHPVEGN